LAARDVAELGMGRQIDRRRKFRRKAIRKVEVDVEAAKVTAFLAEEGVDLRVGNTCPPVACLTWGRAGSPREQTALADSSGLIAAS